MIVTVPDDCADVPRKRFVVDFNRAFAEADVGFVLDHVCDDVVWTMVGGTEVRGKAAMQRAMASMTADAASEMVLHSVITEGREAASNGEFHYPSGETIAFCDVYRFADGAGNAIERITSYAMRL